MASILRNHAGPHRPVGALAALARIGLLMAGLIVMSALLVGCGLKGDLQPPEATHITEATPHATRA